MASHACNEHDVICGRGRSTILHTGNKRFRFIIECHIEKYSNATSRLEKSRVVSDMCDEIRTKGDFVRQIPNGTWIKVTERIAREKCGQGLRDCLHSKYRSSTQAKKARRKSDLEEQTEQISQMIQSNTVIRSVLNHLKDDLKIRQDLADSTIQVMFTTANSRILEELKASRIAEETISASTPSLECSEPSPRPLARTVTDEHGRYASSSVTPWPTTRWPSCTSMS